MRAVQDESQRIEGGSVLVVSAVVLQRSQEVTQHMRIDFAANVLDAFTGSRTPLLDTPL